MHSHDEQIKIALVHKFVEQFFFIVLYHRACRRIYYYFIIFFFIVVVVVIWSYFNDEFNQRIGSHNNNCCSMCTQCLIKYQLINWLMEPNYLCISFRCSTKAIGFIWKFTEKKINTQSNNQSQKFLAKNKHENWIFFSFLFISLFYVHTFRRMPNSVLSLFFRWLLAYFAYRCMCMYVYTLYFTNVHWNRRQYDWMLTIKMKAKYKCQSHTYKKGKRKGKGEIKRKMLNNTQ